jgi:hypothetical protein
MTKHEKIVVSAYTGYMLCDFNDMHAYIEKLLGRPVFTHELASSAIQNEIREKARPDLEAICKEDS